MESESGLGLVIKKLHALHITIVNSCWEVVKSVHLLNGSKLFPLQIGHVVTESCAIIVYLPRYTVSTETSAGETPLMRVTCPIVAGLILFNFSLASDDKALTRS